MASRKTREPYLTYLTCRINQLLFARSFTCPQFTTITSSTHPISHSPTLLDFYKYFRRSRLTNPPFGPSLRRFSPTLLVLTAVVPIRSKISSKHHFFPSLHNTIDPIYSQNKLEDRKNIRPYLLTRLCPLTSTSSLSLVNNFVTTTTQPFYLL